MYAALPHAIHTLSAISNLVAADFTIHITRLAAGRLPAIGAFFWTSWEVQVIAYSGFARPTVAGGVRTGRREQNEAGKSDAP